VETEEWPYVAYSPLLLCHGESDGQESLALYRAHGYDSNTLILIKLTLILRSAGFAMKDK